MKKAVRSDKGKVVRIICESFNDNPHVNSIVKNDEHRAARLAVLAEYAFEFGMGRKAVYLSDDGLGVCIFFECSRFKMSLYEYYWQLILVFKAITLPRALKVNSLESLIKKNRASNLNYIYLWFFGVANEALGSNDAREMLKFVFEVSDSRGLPIYAETSLSRNNKIYKRYGFEDYRFLKTGFKDLKMWFMKRPAGLTSYN